MRWVRAVDKVFPLCHCRVLLVGCVCDLTEGHSQAQLTCPSAPSGGCFLISHNFPGLLSSRGWCGPEEGGGQGKEENTTLGFANAGQILCQQNPQQSTAETQSQLEAGWGLRREGLADSQARAPGDCPP